MSSRKLGKLVLISTAVCIAFIAFGCNAEGSHTGTPMFSLFTLKNSRHYELKYTNTVKNTGRGIIHRQDIWCLIPVSNVNQTVLNVAFNPQPTEFMTDNWGQRVAHYVIRDMKGNSRIEINWTAKVQISDIIFKIDANSLLNLGDIPAEIIKTYTVDDEKYNLMSPVVRQASRKAINNETGMYDMVDSIYEYVINHLSYKMDSYWDDAAITLKRGNGSCSEYTFVLIALCRANGIPVRYVGGTRNRADGKYMDETFHRSAEVYLPKYGWVPLDATLANTRSNRTGYFSRRYADYFILSTAGGKSNLLGWDVNSRLEVEDAKEAEQVVSIRSMQWIPK